jgi:hypothetical protein
MKRHKKESGSALTARVRTEMALPRISKSARMAELSADKTRSVERPKIIIPGVVDRVIRPATPRMHEKVQISIEGHAGYRKLRIENSLTDEHGDEIKLEKGARVELTVTENKNLNEKS